MQLGAASPQERAALLEAHAAEVHALRSKLHQAEARASAAAVEAAAAQAALRHSNAERNALKEALSAIVAVAGPLAS